MDISVGDPSSAGLEALTILRAAAEEAGPLAAQLADRALRVTERADFTVAQDALEALLRRLAAARDAGVIVSGPRRQPLGWYRIGRRGRRAHQHEVLLTSIDPLEGSCSCADFARASLGLCKHLFLVADGRAGGVTPLERPPLRWDPVRPLTGLGDWVERLTWRAGTAPQNAGEARVRRLFRAGAGERLALPAGLLSDPTARLSAIEALADAVRAQRKLAEPAIPPLLERERQELERIRAGAMAPRDIRRTCAGLKQKLFLYQYEAVRRFLERGRLLLADDTGLGKSAQAIAACHVLLSSGRARRGLIVVPAPLKAQWRSEWQRVTDLPLVAEVGPEERARTVGPARSGVMLIDDEQLLRELPRLLQFGPEIVVLDEVQRVKNQAAKIAGLKQLDPRWRLVMTGTPMETRLDQLASIMEWVDDAALEPRWRLDSWHTTWDANGRTVVAARNLETLRQRMAPSMVRRVRRDVIDQLPPRRDTRISVPLTAAQRAAHDELDQPIARIVSQAARRPPSQTELQRLTSLLTRQQAVCNGMAQADFVETWPTIARRRATDTLVESLASPKLTELRELISAIAVHQERKVVVFSQWRRMLRVAAWAVSDVLAAAGVRSVLVSGAEDARRRNQNVREFHDDGDVRVLFATDDGSAGLNVQKAASACIHIDRPWNPAVAEQRTGRIHRIGQEQPVDIYTMVAEDGIEGRVAALAADKQALFTALFDGTGEAVELAGSVIARLQSVLAVTAAGIEVDALDDLPGGREPELATGADDASDGSDDLTGDEDERGDVVPVGGLTQAALESLLGQIQVRQLADGRVSFEAPAPTAAALAELFQGVARLLVSGEPTARSTS
jgi:superfamily II DNA or RNA helicase